MLGAAICGEMIKFISAAVVLAMGALFFYRDYLNNR
jgi:hypothetical protein